MLRSIPFVVFLLVAQISAFDYEKCESGQCFGLPIRCAVTKVVIKTINCCKLQFVLNLHLQIFVDL